MALLELKQMLLNIDTSLNMIVCLLALVACCELVKTFLKK